MAKTLEELQQSHDRKVEANRALGVQEYKNTEKQSDEVWEVTAGRKYVPDGQGGQKVLGPGHLFHPTEGQLKNGSLAGKAREVPASVRRGLDATGKVFRGADIGLRALPMAESTLKLARDSGLSDEDFRDVEPDGQDGQYTFRQVKAMVDARKETAN